MILKKPTGRNQSRNRASSNLNVRERHDSTAAVPQSPMAGTPLPVDENDQGHPFNDTEIPLLIENMKNPKNNFVQYQLIEKNPPAEREPNSLEGKVIISDFLPIRICSKMNF